MGLAPDAFRRLTPGEWRAAYEAFCAVHGLESEAGFGRADLMNLIQKTPDTA